MQEVRVSLFCAEPLLSVETDGADISRVFSLELKFIIVSTEWDLQETQQHLLHTFNMLFVTGVTVQWEDFKEGQYVRYRMAWSTGSAVQSYVQISLQIIFHIC